ncbi:class I SAM-dependent methyltransferase [Devosia sp.]|uniref:class I SAM-dependent methyltransferase n=1 Tax=Devosia sp. TaxID=1871048 RepID=UPI0032671362
MLVKGAKSLLNVAHDKAVFGRRVAVLSQKLADAIPGSGRVLDLGCGDGQIAASIMARRPDLSIEGVDVLVRPKTHIPVTKYDGNVLPFADNSFDFVTIVDVLHHTDDPAAVLTEAARVARQGVVIKDHLREGVLAGPTLRLMDWVGNRGHDVRLPYNYLTLAEWSAAFERAGLVGQGMDDRLGLYPAPLSWLFERDLHFIALLAPRAD